MSEHDYLFDKQGPVPADVQRLEDLLGRFRHGRRAPRPQALPAPRRRPWLWLVPVLAAAAAAMVALALYGRLPWQKKGAAIDVVQTNGDKLSVDAWVDATEQAQHLSMPSRGWLTLMPGSRLHVRRFDDEQGRFYLQRGSLEAFVFPSVKERFFQVETEATTCVDLGCKYTLDVDPQTQVAHVRVSLGQVAFTDGGREVFIPRGAECKAVPKIGAGTPRFSDAAAPLRVALDAFDAARQTQAQRDAAKVVAATSKDKRDTLSLWHLLAHGDDEVRATAEAALVRLVGESKMPRSLEQWRSELDAFWW
jgi:hypothetical protein